MGRRNDGKHESDPPERERKNLLSDEAKKIIQNREVSERRHTERNGRERRESGNKKRKLN